MAGTWPGSFSSPSVHFRGSALTDAVRRRGAPPHKRLKLPRSVSPHLALHMRALLSLSFVASTLLPAPAAGQTDTALTRQVLEVEDRRFAAMLRGDTTALRQLLGDDLTYIHTSGEQDTKTELLRSLGSGELRYESIAPESRTVRIFGGVAVVVGRSSMRAGGPGRVRPFRIRYIAVYAQRDRGWQLEAWESTRLPE